MSCDQRGRRGLAPSIVAAVVRLLERERTTGERLSDRQIAARAGCHYSTVWKIRRGRHRSQQDEDRRGNAPARVRLARELLGQQPRPPLAYVSRLLAMHRRAVRAIAAGTYIVRP